MPPGGKLCRFHAYRTGAGPDIPHDAVVVQRHLCECHGTNFRGGEQPMFRGGLHEFLVGIPKHAANPRLPWAIGNVGIADKHHHIEGLERLLGNFGDRATGDSFVASSQVLAHIDHEIVDVTIEHSLGDLRRRDLLGCEQTHFRGHANFFHDRIEVVIGEIREISFVPTFLHPRERELHAAHMRDDLAPFIAQAVAQKPGQAVEQGIARHQDGDFGISRGTDFLRHRIEISAHGDPLARSIRHEGQSSLVASQNIRRQNELPHGVGDCLESVVANPNDRNRILVHESSSCQISEPARPRARNDRGRQRPGSPYRLTLLVNAL